ncbi:Transposon Ty3-G Gag-Pol polyprotein [Exaiptasia diaphana]|nr:Transposon Ty3-G Gag-Pol polyprotein [Exaiptasia diaphana]
MKESSKDVEKVHAVQGQRKKNKHSTPPRGDKTKPRASKDNASSSRSQNNSKQNKCYHCGRQADHKLKECPAFSLTCRSCGKKNHFASVCLASKNNTRDVRAVEEFEPGLSSDEEPIFHIEEVSSLKGQGKQLFVNLNFLNVSRHLGMELQCQLDTGATCNVIGYDDISRIFQTGNPRLQSSDVKLRTTLIRRFNNATYRPRRVAFSIREEVKAKIKDLESKEIIRKETEPTDWISSMVVIAKANKIRICLDPSDLNKALKRPKYQMPTLDELLPKLNNAKIFTTLDAKDGYYQISLDEPSSKLTTFWTPFCRYKYLRLPFGINTASEEFERQLQEKLADLPGVEVLRDDILVIGYGDKQEEAERDHDQNLKTLLTKAAQINLKKN